MHQSHRNRIFLAVLIATGLHISSVAAKDVIIHQVGAEVDQINVNVDKATGEGSARAIGCKQCPLELGIDASTQFYLNNKTIERERINSFSGKPGTVVYNKDNKHALRIYW